MMAVPKERPRLDGVNDKVAGLHNGDGATIVPWLIEVARAAAVFMDAPAGSEDEQDALFRLHVALDVNRP